MNDLHIGQEVTDDRLPLPVLGKVYDICEGLVFVEYPRLDIVYDEDEAKHLVGATVAMPV